VGRSRQPLPALSPPRSWVSATIDPRDPNLFEFAPQIVPANAG